jgi:hypothetical protein
LKQSPRLWNKALESALLKLGYKKSRQDSALYVKDTPTGRVWLLVYVDDLLAANSSNVPLRELKEALMAEFRVKELLPLELYLGMQITRDRVNRTLTVCQAKYCADLRERFFKGVNLQPLQTPLPPTAFTAIDVEADLHTKTAYQRRLGSLMYGVSCTRPDLAYACSILAQHTMRKSKEDWTLLNRVLQYLVTTATLGLQFCGDEEALVLKGYSDANDASDKQDSKTQSGYAFVWGGAAISWQSKKQNIVTKSSTESEYVAAVEAASEAVWLRNLLAELMEPTTGPTTLCVDNRSAIALSCNYALHARTKHIRRRFHWLRQAVECDFVSLVHVEAQVQWADIFTRLTFTKCCSGLGLKNIRAPHQSKGSDELLHLTSRSACNT